MKGFFQLEFGSLIPVYFVDQIVIDGFQCPIIGGKTNAIIEGSPDPKGRCQRRILGSLRKHSTRTISRGRQAGLLRTHPCDNYFFWPTTCSKVQFVFAGPLQDWPKLGAVSDLARSLTPPRVSTPQCILNNTSRSLFRS